MKRNCEVCGKKYLPPRGYKMHMARMHLVPSGVIATEPLPPDPLAGMVEANPLDALKEEAESDAEKGQHTLGAWSDEPGWAHAKCVFCGMGAAVSPSPAQGNQRVSGPAVSQRCSRA